MVRQPYLKKGTWSRDEDQKLIAYITRYGIWNWNECPDFLEGGKENKVVVTKRLVHLDRWRAGKREWERSKVTMKVRETECNRKVLRVDERIKIESKAINIFRITGEAAKRCRQMALHLPSPS
ncbi:hypothetical protein Gotur_032440 [Gossypium turneri]